MRFVYHTNGAMRLPALACALALAACGRLGYEEHPDGSGADGPDVDAPDGPIDGPDPGVLLQCGTATELLDFGDTGGTSALNFSVDAARTDAGFLVAWSAGNGNVWVTALGLADGPRVSILQSMQHVVFENGVGVSISAMGNAAMLGVDDADGAGTHLFALDELGFERSSSKYIEDHHAFGHDFVIADPANDVFVAMAASATDVAAFHRDHDIHPLIGPVTSFTPLATESAAAVPRGTGYAVISGNSTNCHIGLVDAALAPVGSSQTQDMTCHNASLVKSVTSDKIVAAWNCDNNDVWTTGGDPSMQLPANHAVSDASTQPASNPRVAAADPGIWYAWQVGTDRLARALVNDDSIVITGAEPLVVHTSANLKAYDLVTNGTYGFLFWIEVDAGATKLFTMKLCPP
jgi:hypothetical protein